MSSPIILTVYTAPSASVSARIGVRPKCAADDWAAEHPTFTGLLSVHVPGLPYRSYMVAGGRTRARVASVSPAVGPCPAPHRDRHRGEWWWDEDAPERPFVLLCGFCKQELARWPSVSVRGGAVCAQ